jgi:hypothetical protein
MGQTALKHIHHDEVERDEFVAGAVLSTDYLNRYGEALMLIEMAVMDASVIEDLRNWKPVSYREHFTGSELRCAVGALHAYEQLSKTQGAAFDNLCGAMNRLVDTVIIVLTEIGTESDAMMVVEVAATAFHNLLTRATAFINSGGVTATAHFDGDALQDAVDQLMSF